MQRKFNKKLDKNLLEKLGVRLAVVFGSFANSTNRPDSDLDIGIVFQNIAEAKKDPVALYSDLRDEFSEKYKTENIDLVYLEETPLSLQYRAANDGIPVYEADIAAFADFKERAWKFYFDFKYHENIMNELYYKK